MHALGRLGQADEVASMAVFLASDDASFCTGQPFIVDGGLSAGYPGDRRLRARRSAALSVWSS